MRRLLLKRLQPLSDALDHPPRRRRGTNCLGVRRSVLTLGGNRHWAHEVEVVVGLIWRLVAQPLLFGIIGSLLGFKNLDIRTLPLSLGLVICGALCVSPLPVNGCRARETSKQRAHAWPPPHPRHPPLPLSPSRNRPGGAAAHDILQHGGRRPDAEGAPLHILRLAAKGHGAGGARRRAA